MGRRGWAGFVLSAFFLTGCATTGRNYQTDIDSLNARVSALQGQLAEKDQEISKLQNQVNDQGMAREAAESAMKNAENERRALEAQLEAARAKKAAAVPSDIK